MPRCPGPSSPRPPPRPPPRTPPRSVPCCTGDPAQCLDYVSRSPRVFCLILPVVIYARMFPHRLLQFGDVCGETVRLIGRGYVHRSFQNIIVRVKLRVFRQKFQVRSSIVHRCLNRESRHGWWIDWVSCLYLCAARVLYHAPYILYWATFYSSALMWHPFIRLNRSMLCSSNDIWSYAVDLSLISRD